MGVSQSNLESLERFISAELESRRHPGSSVSVVTRDKIVWSKGFGKADVKKGTPATPDTIYGCASVTKPVVTFGFLQLMEKGKFSLDDPVNDHLDVKIKTDYEEEPVMRDLLTHYTGMPTMVPPLFHNRKEALTLREYIATAARTVRPRGEAWAYCNTGFAIIGHLMELFTGEPYDAYVDENVLKPLEMHSSAFDQTPAIMQGLARGYKRAGGHDKPLIPNEPYVLGTLPQDPAGSLYSTVMDLGNFVIANLNRGIFMGRRVLREETIEEMHRLQMSPGESRSGMALTWFRNIHNGHVTLSHTGGLPDYTNHVAFYPELGIGVCWLSNLQDGSGWRPPAPTALRIVAGEDAPFDPASIQTVPENWRSLIGIYGDEKIQHHVRVANGYLMLDELYLERLDEATYIVHGPTNDGYELTFEYGEDGSAKQYDLGTNVYPRYVKRTLQLDEGTDLVGTWRGEYYDFSGFHVQEIEIEGPSTATAIGKEGEKIPLRDFTAESGRVMGTGTFRIPVEFARWGTQDEIDVTFELVSIRGKLRGLIRSAGGAIDLTMEKFSEG
jgi:CubicO group peptidase (beta-lactamase class C family)